MRRSLPSNRLRDRRAEQRLFRNRAIIMAVLCAAALVYQVVQLLTLQVLQYEDFSTKSHNNRVRVVAAPPTRGLIYDRNGVLLAENQPAYRLDIIREQVKDVDATLARLQQLVTITEDDLKRFKKQGRRRRGFQAVTLKAALTEDELARVSVNQALMPGVILRAYSTRRYPQGQVMGHVVGYVGQISEADLKRIDNSAYKGSSHTGKVGIERSYEKVLHGRVGYRQVETNAEGRTLKTLAFEPPQPGRDVYLTLDVRLQKAALEALEGKSGSIVAIAPKTGEVLVLASNPGYDPNPFVNGIDRKSYEILRTNPKRPLFHRAVKGQYPPGSTIKPMFALAGLEYNVVTPPKRYYCPGYLRLPNSEHKYRDWKRWGHGKTDMHSAIVESCDVYFYELALAMGIDRMHQFMSTFGVGKVTGVDLLGEEDGLLPSRHWKQGMYGEPWFPGETLINGIGQGFMLTTPLQLADLTATLANRGKRMKPRMVYAMTEPVAEELRLLNPVQQGEVKLSSMRYWDEVIDAMRDVVQGRKGTAKRIKEGLMYEIAGKTGTAQVFGLDQESTYDADSIAEELRDHALFVGFAPINDPEIAIGIIVENGGSGGAIAAPLARKVFDAFMRIKHPGLLPDPEPEVLAEEPPAVTEHDHAGHSHQQFAAGAQHAH